MNNLAKGIALAIVLGLCSIWGWAYLWPLLPSGSYWWTYPLQLTTAAEVLAAVVIGAHWFPDEEK